MDIIPVLNIMDIIPVLNFVPVLIKKFLYSFYSFYTFYQKNFDCIVSRSSLD